MHAQDQLESIQDVEESDDDLEISDDELDEFVFGGESNYEYH